MVPQIECSWMGGKKKVGGERGRDGWAAFPGLSCYLSRCKNVYSQRLPLGQGWLALTGNKPRPMSQSFSSGWQPSLSGTPTTRSLTPPTSTSPLLNTLPHLSLSGTPARGCQGQVGPVKVREDVCPA